MRNLKRDISKWNREVCGKLDYQRNKVLEELGFLEQIAEHRENTREEKLKALSLKLDLKQIAIAKEISWRQKSRCLWLKEGDKNTKFFQRMANSHRRGNSIDKLKIEGEIIEDADVIKEGILDFYQNL